MRGNVRLLPIGISAAGPLPFQDRLWMGGGRNWQILRSSISFLVEGLLLWNWVCKHLENEQTLTPKITQCSIWVWNTPFVTSLIHALDRPFIPTSHGHDWHASTWDPQGCLHKMFNSVFILTHTHTQIDVLLKWYVHIHCTIRDIPTHTFFFFGFVLINMLR